MKHRIAFTGEIFNARIEIKRQTGLAILDPKHGQLIYDALPEHIKDQWDLLGFSNEALASSGDEIEALIGQIPD